MTSRFPRKQFAHGSLGRAVWLSGLLLLAGQMRAADHSLPATGNLFGTVVDVTGTPQMGATIQLFNKYERVIAKTVTGSDGRFAFTSVPNDVYSVRATLVSFLPAAKNKILVQGGVDSVLQIHLATLFSNIEVSYTIPTSAMTDDWKWVLRSSPSTRPINRYVNVGLAGKEEDSRRLFSQTHAMFSVSGGNGGVIDSDSSFTDLGTGFALSTNIYGNNQLRLSGTFGENGSFGPPQMALLATYSRKDEGTLARPPEVTLTMSQVGGLSTPLNGPNVNGGMGGFVPLRAMSLSVYNVADPLDGVHLEYGVTGESVDYLQHTSRVSPFARLTVDAGKAGEVVVAYSDGGRPDVLSRHDGKASEAKSDDLSSALTGVGRLPEISSRDGRLRLQRTQNAEVGIKKNLKVATFAASAFYEDTIDGRINVAGDVGYLAPGNLLSDTLSTTKFLNVGNYRRSGYLVSSTRSLGDSLDVSLAYGRMGGFSANPSAGNAQVMLSQTPTDVAAVNVRASVPRVATQITADYGWVQSGSVVPRHVFTTQNMYLAPGLNICFRQPLPPMLGLPGRLELTGNLQNLLAQGYLPVDGTDGRRLLIVQSPRAIRGGLNFIF